MAADRAYSNKSPDGRVALLVLLVGPFMSLFDQFCVNLAAPSIDRSFTLSPFEFQAVVGGYGLTYGLGLITGGRLGDRYGRRRLYRLGLALFAGTSLLCGLAWSPVTIIIARLAQGASAALLQPQVLALIRVRLADDRRAAALSWYGVAMSAGMVCGQLLGGAIPGWDLFGLGWRPVFLLSVPVCLAGCMIAGRVVPADPAEPGTGQRPDLVGMALSATGFALLLTPLAAVRELDLQRTGLPLLLVSALILAGFVIHQIRRHRATGAALLPVPLFRVPAFVLGVLLNFALYVASVPFFVLLGLYLQDHLKLSPGTAGLAFTPAAVGIAAGSRLGPRVSRRLGQGTLIASAALTSAGLGGALYVIAELPGRDGLLPLLVSIAVFGFGNGTSVPLVTGIVLSHLPARDAGAGSGVLTTAQQLAAASGVAITGAFLYAGGGLRYTPAMTVVVVFAAATVLIAAVLVSPAVRG